MVPRWSPRDMPLAKLLAFLPTRHHGGGSAGITFSAESSCYDASGWCGLDILVDGTPARPDDDFAFDSSDGDTETIASYESHSIQRSTNVLNAGTYTIEVQFYNGSGGPNIRWDDWHLTVERILKPS